MKALRIAVVDDEPLARARLRRLLAMHEAGATVHEYDSGPALLAAWHDAPADVVFVDIQMPEMDGFAAMAGLPPPRPQVIFVTAHAEHAVQAFEIAAADYLIKPVAPERLSAALRRVRERIAAAPAPATYPPRLALPIGRRVQLVDVDAIDCVLAQANYVEIRVGTRCFVLRKPLTVVQQELDPARFARVHRSALVRITAVAGIEPLPSGRFRLQLAAGQVLTSGRSYREHVRRTFGLSSPAAFAG
ncbi:LytR/AlgR family response regulator transcription factor [Dokdonella koreensis]|uniref:Sensory transduction protein lytT n=1 Tax=Dokdonella koreensis DS-123 TaxID=1300342 RepID=A0A160DWS7_9GAMM|nr:LytTR family DNA-binding domain-containing protein [Dokdonella koreensis]ANB19108.1 Sensory transduction protein lytT [Dokdonella koreensis DS-123]